MNHEIPAVIEPTYGESTLAEVVPSAVAALEVDGWPNALNLPPATAYVILLVDGLGWRLLQKHAEEAPYLTSLAVDDPITSGVPSTTATSLTSLGTGLPPGAHGVVGFTCRIPGTDRLLDALKWDARVDPREWQVHETAFARAAKDGVPLTVVSKRMFAASGLTQAGQRGAEFVGADSIGERISATVHAAMEDRSLTYVYEGELDATGHRAGCASWAWRYQLAMVDSFAQMLREALPSDATLVITADHGMVDVDPQGRIDVTVEPDLLDGVTLMGGEARFRHLYCDHGAVGEVAAHWANRLQHNAIVVTRDDAIERGWFGAVDPHVRPRLGDVMVASVGEVAVMSSEVFPNEAGLVGLHGSVTPEEMLVPLLLDPAR
jgi:Type I phosphodiesterase / nucleotide pyrophosphatase